jgi:predicted phosphohydrolase
VRLAWTSDIHLDTAKPPARAKFYKSLVDADCNGVIVTGDIAHGHTLETMLAEMAKAVPLPIWFVAGNHDYYTPSASVTVGEIREIIRELCGQYGNLHYLADSKNTRVVELSPTVALVGHDGWADGREGNWRRKMAINDPVYIADLAMTGSDATLHKRIQAFAQEATDHLREASLLALRRYRTVIAATHVPPFREATWHEGCQSEDEALPWFCSKVTGETLDNVMAANPNKQMLVLCGHCHGGGEAQIRPNLKVWTGAAQYGTPAVCRVINTEEVDIVAREVQGFTTGDYTIRVYHEGGRVYLWVRNQTMHRSEIIELSRGVADDIGCALIEAAKGAAASEKAT